MNNMQELYQSIEDTEQQLNKLKKLKELLEQLKPDTIQEAKVGDTLEDGPVVLKKENGLALLKIYAIMDNAFGESNEIHSYYFSNKKAQEKSNQMRKELRFFEIGYYMLSHGFDEETATKWVNKFRPITDRLYEVKEIDVEV
jgi:C-terminal processing protease CtpA/Prc